jgi:histidyl-tRNA synthetase
MQKVRGTQDILPDESFLWQKIEDAISEVCKNFGFSEVRLPVIEHTEVFKRSIGEETDIVSKEMYSFQSRGEKSITLRPEGTAGVARSYGENKIYGKENITKWYYKGPMFRAERPQKGRQRQFHQAGIELIGSSSPLADAEVILANIAILEKLGLKEYSLKLNSVGDENSRPAYIEALKVYFKNKLHILCDQCKVRYEKNILRVLDCKNASCQDVLDSCPSITEYLDSASKEHFESVKELIGGVDFTEDKRLVRGLDYYTRTAFEITSNLLGGQDALLGGGRYDNLIGEFCGKKIPAVGSAIGLERLIIALKEGELIKDTAPAPDAYIVYFDKEQQKYAFSLANKLRAKKSFVLVSFDAKKIGSQFKDADKSGAKKVIVIGDDELSRKQDLILKIS